MNERCPARLLCLGNDLIADDAFGIAVARRLRRDLAGVVADADADILDPAVMMTVGTHPVAGPVEIVETALSGLYLMDAVVGASLLIVVDAMATLQEPPGTVMVFAEQDIVSVPGGSPHYVGLFEILTLGRSLGLDVPDEVVIVAVEADDMITIGGGMTEAVSAAVPAVVTLVDDLLAGNRPG